MRNIADKRLILLLAVDLLLGIVLQPLAHLLEALAQFPDLIVALRLDCKVEVALFNIKRGILQLLDRVDQARVDPDRQHTCGEKQDQHN